MYPARALPPWYQLARRIGRQLTACVPAAAAVGEAFSIARPARPPGVAAWRVGEWKMPSRPRGALGRQGQAGSRGWHVNAAAVGLGSRLGTGRLGRPVRLAAPPSLAVHGKRGGAELRGNSMSALGVVGLMAGSWMDG